MRVYSKISRDSFFPPFVIKSRSIFLLSFFFSADGIHSAAFIGISIQLDGEAFVALS